MSSVKKFVRLNAKDALNIKNAATSLQKVSGFTHTYYRYPARFSPLFVREVISTFSSPGDLIYDPFVGGGTTLVESRALGRQSVGSDINSLATFVSDVKTRFLSRTDRKEVIRWADLANKEICLRNKIKFKEEDLKHIANISCKKTWPIRNAIKMYLNKINQLESAKQKKYAQCALLNISQWALDSKINTPNVEQFRNRFIHTLENMSIGMDELFRVSSKNDCEKNSFKRRVRIINSSAIGIEKVFHHGIGSKPNLIIASPPYPGVHVLYHRWQVFGRKETSAPYWIARAIDGSGAAYYAMGERKESKLVTYYDNLYLAFSSLSKICNKSTLVVQAVSFNDKEWQLPAYLNVMEKAGFKELKSKMLSTGKDERLWRAVPNRKWHANSKGILNSAKEVILFHSLK